MIPRIPALLIAALLAWPLAPAAQDASSPAGDDAAAAAPASDDAQESAPAPQLEPEPPQFGAAASSVQRKLDAAVEELSALNRTIEQEQIPLNRELRELESELSEVRAEYQKTTRLLDSRSLDLSNLRTEIKSRRDEAAYLVNLLGEYTRNVESRLHIVELQRYADELQTATLALENANLSREELYDAEIGLLETSLARLEDALGGTRFDASAVDPDGLVKQGQVVMLGPAAWFRSEDGAVVGTAEERLGSLEPTVIPFANPEDRAAAEQLVRTGSGAVPFDPTQGNAHKIEAIEETFLEHVAKGGAVMWPIGAMAAAALLIALVKWASIAFLKKPSQKQIDGFLEAVEQGDGAAAAERARKLGGPVGRMLSAGVANLRESRELIEEVMYEKVLTTRLKLERFLPFIAICAASAPLLGLLGTVTGIINTFKLITVFGSGDVKSLSGGISEALITTKFGLIVAIPSLLLHAFLSRKVRGVISQMETAAVSFVNQLSKTRAGDRRAEEREARALEGASRSAPSEPDPVGV